MEVRVGAVLLDAAAPFDALGDVAGSARSAERVGLDSLWPGDHLLLGDSPLLDSTLTLAAAAAVTQTIAIGSAIFLPSLRPLAWAGRQVATLAHLASGRLELGVGAGAARSRSTARRVSCAVTVGGGRMSSSKPFRTWWPVAR